MAEDPINKVKIKNPDGSTTYRDTWFKSSTSKSSEGKTKNNATLVRQTKSASKPPEVSYYSRSTPKTSFFGSREITTAPPLKSVGIKTQEITAPLDIKVPVKTPTRAEKYQSDKSTWEKNHSEKKWEDRYKEQNKEAQNKQKEKYQSEGSLRSVKRNSKEKGSSPCKTC